MKNTTMSSQNKIILSSFAIFVPCLLGLVLPCIYKYVVGPLFEGSIMSIMDINHLYIHRSNKLKPQWMRIYAFIVRRDQAKRNC